MPDLPPLEHWSKIVESILCPPFEWCPVKGGRVVLEDASRYGGTAGGSVQVADFAMAKYPITNAQYERFLQNPSGFANLQWWEYSAEAAQWRKDRGNPTPTAFRGSNLPRTRVSWFDAMAFCGWLSAEFRDRLTKEAPLEAGAACTCNIRLPLEQEWQRAALGDTGWRYPWGDTLDESRANHAGNIGQPSQVEKYPDGKSVYGVMDMIGNVWEWCRSGWNQADTDLRGYVLRVIKGGAWNVSIAEYLRANDRGAWPPRGRLNDCGFRPLLGPRVESHDLRVPGGERKR